MALLQKNKTRGRGVRGVSVGCAGGHSSSCFFLVRSLGWLFLLLFLFDFPPVVVLNYVSPLF